MQEEKKPPPNYLPNTREEKKRKKSRGTKNIFSFLLLPSRPPSPVSCNRPLGSNCLNTFFSSPPTTNVKRKKTQKNVWISQRQATERHYQIQSPWKFFLLSLSFAYSGISLRKVAREIRIIPRVFQSLFLIFFRVCPPEGHWLIASFPSASSLFSAPQLSAAPADNKNTRRGGGRREKSVWTRNGGNWSPSSSSLNRPNYRGGEGKRRTDGRVLWVSKKEK